MGTTVVRTIPQSTRVVQPTHHLRSERHRSIGPVAVWKAADPRRVNGRPSRGARRCRLRSGRAVQSGIRGADVLLVRRGSSDRVVALILVNAFARLARAADHPWGIPATAAERIMAELEDGWGKGGGAEIFAPSRADDEEFRRWFGRYRRLGARPRRAVEGYRVMFETDVRHVLPNITVPTLIIHRIGDRHVVVAHGRDLARRIHDAKYIELPGVDHPSLAGRLGPHYGGDAIVSFW
jgi:pimeloyl-ACP methyl ester carboxylesterase